MAAVGLNRVKTSFEATQVKFPASSIRAWTIINDPSADWMKLESLICTPFFNQWITRAAGFPRGGWQRNWAWLPNSICWEYGGVSKSLLRTGKGRVYYQRQIKWRPRWLTSLTNNGFRGHNIALIWRGMAFATEFSKHIHHMITCDFNTDFLVLGTTFLIFQILFCITFDGFFVATKVGFQSMRNTTS